MRRDRPLALAMALEGREGHRCPPLPGMPMRYQASGRGGDRAPASGHGMGGDGRVEGYAYTVTEGAEWGEAMNIIECARR